MPKTPNTNKVLKKDLNKFKLPKLRELCHSNSIPTSGKNKATLIEDLVREIKINKIKIQKINFIFSIFFFTPR